MEYDSRLIAFVYVESTNIYKTNLLFFFSILLTNKWAILLVSLLQ
jgi:hypothetical protein